MRRKKRAFTLLEILVVLAILGMGLALITTMTTTIARYSSRVEEETLVQLACENMMNSILAGSSVALIGVETPIPDVPNWSMSVELLDGPIPNLVAVRITAQRYETIETPSMITQGAIAISRVPEDGRRYVIKEWARRAEIKTRIVKTDEKGETSAVDGTGETVWSDLNSGQNGSLGGAYDPFAAVEQANGVGSNELGSVPSPMQGALMPDVGGFSGGEVGFPNSDAPMGATPTLGGGL